MFNKWACVHVVYVIPMSIGVWTIWRRNLFHFVIYTQFLMYDQLSGPSCEAVGKGSVTNGLGADISLPPCLSERPGIWKLSVLRLKATSGPKSRGALSRYSALATRPEVPSPGPPFFFRRRMRSRFLGPLRGGAIPLPAKHFEQLGPNVWRDSVDRSLSTT